MSDLAKAVAELSTGQRAILERRLRARHAAAAPAPSIPRRGDAFSFPLSFAQHRLWFLDQLDPTSPLYVLPAAARLRGEMAVEVLARSLSEIVCRHEVLRAAFTGDRGRPVQTIAPASAAPLPVVDLSGLAAVPREAVARRLAEDESLRPFVLASGGLLRATLVRLAARDHLLLVSLHHIVADGWSVGVLLRELAALYRALLGGKPSPLPALPIQYADFAHWQREWLQGEVLERQLAYWRGRLAGAPTALDLPSETRRSPSPAPRGGAVPVALGAEVVARLKKLATGQEATLFMMLVAGWSALLARYSGQQQLLVGTPIANRNRLETEGLIGLFVNTLALRCDLAGDPAAHTLLARVREETLGAYAHQDLPFERLVEELAPARSLAHSPLFQVMLVLQNAPLPELRLPGLELTVLDPVPGRTKFDLTLTLTETGGGLSGTLECAAGRFAAEQVRRLGGHFENLLAAMALAPEARLAALPMLSGAERSQLLLEWNDTQRPYPPNLRLHQLFERQVERTPDALAVVSGEERLSFGELETRANRLAHRLRRLGVGPEARVALALERSATMVVALVAVLKAGGAYLPVDPAYPEARRRYMLQDSGARLVVTQASLASGLAGAAETVLDLDAERPSLERESAARPPPSPDPLNLAYVLYTSGSSGRPKGAMISHAAICNHMLWMQEEFPLGIGDRVAQKTPFSFDASVWEFWAPLTSGACLVMARPGGHQDPAYLVELIRRQGVTTFQVVPTLLELFLQQTDAGRCTSVGRIYCGGEALSPGLAERCREILPWVELLNVYGPTEASIHASSWSSRRGGIRGSVPIGRPIANAQVYLLDPEMAPVPAGVDGLIHVGGAGLGRGYLGRAEMTAAAFVPDPWSAAPGGRLYCTGDLGRFLPDGAVEFLGRRDGQVKVRGFRIELGEIEAVLAGHPGVRQAAVAPHQDGSGAHRLAAYAVAREGCELHAAELRAHLKAHLPEHMIPADYVMLAALPLLPNGKLDRRALPAVRRTGGERSGPAAPRTPTEELVAAAWSEVLGVAAVGVNDNFFELGGHSLLATQVLARLREAFAVELPLRSLFEAPTVAELAGQVEAARRGAPAAAGPELVAVPRTAGLMASFAQERLWFLDQLQPGNAAYNLPVALRLTGTLELRVLAAALDEEARRHEILRTSFPSLEGRPVPLFSPPAPRPPPLIDLSRLPAARREAAAARLAGEEGGRPFDLARGPLWRALVLRLAPREHVLWLSLHHILSDGWSTGVLLRETLALYRAAAAGQPSPLGELTLQFADFAQWQRLRLRGEVLARELAYWTGCLRGAPALSTLPGDRPRPAAQSFRGGYRAFAWPEPLAAAVAGCGRRLGLTPFMVLLASFAALLQRCTAQDDLSIGTPVANRNRREVEGLIGPFANTLVLRADLSGEPTARELLLRVRETALAAYAHQELPLELLVEALAPARDLSHNPLFQVLFTLHHALPPEPDLPGLQLAPVTVAGGGARFDLALELAPSAQGLRGGIEFSADLFETATVLRLVAHYETLTAGLLADPERRIAELPLLSRAELHQVLHGWNDTGARFPGELTVSRLFEAAAARHPAATALICGGESLSYDELNRRANRLARHLRRRGVESGTLVGVHLARSLDLPVALLAIWKAGAAYLPLDPSYPAERIALMLEDSGVRLVVSHPPLGARLAAFPGVLVDLAAAAPEAARESAADPASAADALALAYVIYTSGSTGRPKGVMVAHRSVANFFHGMDARLGGAPGTWLAVTSIAFDISLLELFWTLCRGCAVVLQTDATALLPAPLAPPRAAAARTIDFSLFFFASDEQEETHDRYRLLLEAAKYADGAGFQAIWTPERHFHAFGGLYPNPSVTSAALAAVTERIEIRAGSVVLPLHHPLRIAEEWAVVDNLSRGRVGISFASGWHAVDFVLSPENFGRRKEIMFEGIETVRRLWRGEEITLPGVSGDPVRVSIRPRPVRGELPVWVTAAGSAETFRRAGEIGAGVLTHLLGQTVEELAATIAVYREAWAGTGRPGAGHVTLMLHTFVGPDREAVKATVYRPFRAYLESSVSLIRGVASSLGLEMDSASFTRDDLDALLDHAFDRYFEAGSLFGTLESCRRMIRRLEAAGVDEVGCLIDFGVPADQVLASLPELAALRRECAAGAAGAPAAAETPGDLVTQLSVHGVSHLQCTPSLARMLVADPATLAALGSLSALLLGGEALAPDLAASLAGTVGGRLHNMYGPTETTVWSATDRVEAGCATVSIGRPIANTFLYILDRGGQPVPAGVHGELFIGGEGVVRGYLGRPELTAERFLPDPFAAARGARFYRTGDLARFLPDGRIDCLGRTDHQVKIRGFRVELGEIEAALGRHPAVLAAAVVLGEGRAGGPLLVAYVVARQAGRAAAAELRGFLARSLPEYMVPGAFVELESMPLTPNGKIDRGALPAPGDTRPGLEQGFAAPRTPLQEILAEVWAELLGVARVGMDDDFFELGGHSLLATRLVARLRQTLRLDLPLRAIFEASTVARLAERIERARQEEAGTAAPPLVPVPRRARHALSFAQQRIWFLEQLEPGSAAYHDRAAIQLAGPLDVAVLGGSLEEIARRHESLRTTFSLHEGRPVQAVAPASAAALAQVDLAGLPAARREPEVAAAAAVLARRPFDLAAGPLLRTALFRLEPRRHILVLAVHHIIWDGWSLGVLLRELLRLYPRLAAGEPSPLPPLAVQYIDYSEWQRQWLRGELLETQLSYWKRRLTRVSPPAELATDRPRAALRGDRGSRLPQVLDAELASGVRALGRSQGATLFMTLTAAFKALVSQAGGGFDVVVGTDVANRDRVETEPLIGFFVNQLVLRTDLGGDPDFCQLLGRVRETALDAYAHQDVPFDRVVDAVQHERTLGQTPLFQVKFVLQNVPIPTETPAGLELRPFEVGWDTAKFDLLLNMVDTGSTLEGLWEYSTGLFEIASIAHLQRKFEVLLRFVVQRPHSRLSEVAAALAAHDRGRDAGLRQEREGANRDRLAKTRRRAFAGAAAGNPQ